jgi:hypothetical protein
MAEAQRSLLKNSSSIDSIQKSINSFGKSLRVANSTSSIIIKQLSDGNRDKKAAILKKTELFQMRREAVRRREQEDIIESGKVTSLSSSYSRGSKLIASSTKGFLGRVMDFIGTIMVGWLINNLPNIIKGAQKLGERIQQVFDTLSTWKEGLFTYFSDFISFLQPILTSITGIDFNQDVKEARKNENTLNVRLQEVENQFETMRQDIENFDLAKILGLSSDANAGEMPGGGMAGGTPGASGKLLPIHKKALDIISGPESGGDYNAMNNGQAGDRPGGAKKWLGKNLTDMTIGEVKDFQNNKKTLWAAGRYQIIPGTLPTAQKGAGLSDSDKFDEANQDLMGIALLKIQGHQAWSRYSSYTPAEIAVLEKAKATPYGQVQTTRPSGSYPTSSANINIDPNKRISTGSRVGDTIKSDFFGSMAANRTRPHGGADYACDIGTYIACKLPCKVVEARFQAGYGYYTDIIIPSLSIRLRFAHLSTQLITSGNVPAGTPFARSGSTGRSTGPHIHMEATANLSGTSYGGDFSPDPYTDVMIFSKNPPVTGTGGGVLDTIKRNLGIGGPSLEPVPSQTDVARQVTPERSAKVIPVPIPMGGKESPAPAPRMEGEKSTISLSSGENTLNSFVTQALLRELEYT